MPDWLFEFVNPWTTPAALLFLIVGIAWCIRIRGRTLAIVAMVAAVIAAYLYLKIMVSMWLEDPADESRPVVPAPVAVVVTVAVVFTLVVGFLPGWLLNATSSIGG